MRIKFLGTAAAEGWPGVFCQCENCRKAKATGGKNLRTRSSILVNTDLKVDLPPDTYYHVLKHELDLAEVENLIVTHTHQDHFYVDELNMRREPFAEIVGGKVMRVCGNEDVCARVQQLNRLSGGRLEGAVETMLFEPFRKYELGSYSVVPLIADHSETEQCFVYLVSDGERKIMHGYDSGWFPEVTWRFIEGAKLDLVILDCTNGPISTNRYHMGISGVLGVRSEMMRREIATEETAFVATHFSHNGGLSHEELIKRLEPEGVRVAYDGLAIDI